MSQKLHVSTLRNLLYTLTVVADFVLIVRYYNMTMLGTSSFVDNDSLAR